VQPSPTFATPLSPSEQEIAPLSGAVRGGHVGTVYTIMQQDWIVMGKEIYCVTYIFLNCSLPVCYSWFDQNALFLSIAK